MSATTTTPTQEQRAERGPCSVDDCRTPSHAWGLCQTHYDRLRRHGTLDGVGTPKGEVAGFVQHAAQFSGDDCLPWPYSKHPNGYGRINVKGAVRGAHSVVCELAHGPSPNGTEAAHACGVRACVNPRHLRWATSAENKSDALRHGTRPRGERHGQAKLTEAEVQVIRHSTASQRKLAERFSVSQRTISLILRWETWR